MERPALRADEPMPLAANMNITVHPIAVTDKAYGFCCDNYIVGESKGNADSQDAPGGAGDLGRYPADDD